MNVHATKNNHIARARAVAKWVLGITLFSAIFFFFMLPNLIDRIANGVGETFDTETDPRILALHHSLVLTDLHADTLLWDRDPAVRWNYGHLDLPRMRDAGIAIQVFSAVTKTPQNLNFERNGADSDNITALVIAERWPSRTWNDLAERALYQAARLEHMAADSHGMFFILRTRNDVEHLLADRAAGSRRIGGLLAIEGLHALAGEPANVRRFYDAGFRMMGLTHFFDNALGGSAHGLKKGGLTEFGRTVITEMERAGIIVDLAHASPELIDNVLAIAQRPVVVSHTGVKATCNRTRNLSDEQLRAIAANGGLVGIAYFEEAVCGTDAASIATAIRHVVDLIGIDHVALGSDFDGAVTTPFDVTGLPQLTEALVRAGFGPAEIRAITGGNTVRLLESLLPAE